MTRHRARPRHVSTHGGRGNIDSTTPRPPPARSPKATRATDDARRHGGWVTDAMKRPLIPRGVQEANTSRWDIHHGPKEPVPDAVEPSVRPGDDGHRGVAGHSEGGVPGLAGGVSRRTTCIRSTPNTSGIEVGFVHGRGDVLLPPQCAIRPRTTRDETGKQPEVG